MSSISEKGNGGNFRLTGRKSIHNHGTNCPFWNCETMGRYGLNTNRHAQGSTSQDVDEVDNVMSKMARASSPMATRKSDNNRRNSLNSPNQLNQNYTDDSDEDSKLLSKSSPAILSPYSCCSEEAEGDDSTTYTLESANSSLSQSQNGWQTNRHLHTPLQNMQIGRRNIDKATDKQSTKKGSTILLPMSIIITVLIGVFLTYNNVFTSLEETKNIIYDKFNFYSDIKGVGNKYKISDNSILQVRTGVAAIFERQDTGSFIFVYNSSKKDFNLVNFNNFVNELASAAARYLRNHTKTTYHVVVDTNNLQLQSDKQLMNEYVDDVDKTGVMLVKDLDRMPSNLAMAFHYYCDEYNPLVKKSAIFFTLNMAKCSNMSSEKYTHKNIEKCLAEKWIKMPHENIRPLLNRVVNVVIDVTGDF